MINLFIKNGKKLLTKEQPNILSASAIMMVILICTKFIGLFSKTIAVTQLGADDYGIFVAANAFPEFLSLLLILGSVTSVIIPILVESLHEGNREEFSKLFSSLLNLGLLSFVFFSVILIISTKKFLPFIVEKFTSPNEPYTQEQIEQIASMMRWLLIPQIILAVSGFISSTLNAFKRFIIPQLAPFFYNVGVLSGALFLIPLLKGSVWGLTWGTLIGAILHFLVQFPLGVHLKIKYIPIIEFSNIRLRKAIIIGLPRIIALAADQVAIIVDKFIAFGIGLTQIGAYQLAVSLVTIPYSLFSNTFSVAALPHLSEAYTAKNMEKFRSIFQNVFNQVLFFTVPTTIIILVLRLPIVRLFYGIFGKEFTWDQTLMVSWVVFFFTFGLIPEVLMTYLTRTFYSITYTIRPLLVGIFVVVFGIITGITFTNYFSNFDTFSVKTLYWNPSYFFQKSYGIAAIGGLALSSSVVYTIAFVILVIMITKKIGGFGKLWLHFAKKLFCGLVMGFLMYMLFKVWDEVLDTARTANLLILTLSTIIPGITIYLWLSYMFKEKEVKLIEDIFKLLRKILLTKL